MYYYWTMRRNCNSLPIFERLAWLILLSTVDSTVVGLVSWLLNYEIECDIIDIPYCTTILHSLFCLFVELASLRRVDLS